ncbi:(Fe-S)-binding protein [Spirochaetia bacterium]|nr:(Fe-S)-binding protein [Spirochaetia bacterium]
MPYISFFIEDKTNKTSLNARSAGEPFFAVDGITLLEASRAAGTMIESPCNGNGTCGKCKVIILHNDDPSYTEKVPACRTKITGESGDMCVFIPDYKAENDTLNITSEGISFNYTLHPFITKETPCYGLVVDIGTTTLALSIIDAKTGKAAASISSLNPQAAYAQDVLSRIQFASTAEGLKTLHGCLVRQINEMIGKMASNAGVKKENIYEVVYSGNTTMLYLACGIDPAPLGKYPYTSNIKAGHIKNTGLDIAPDALVYLPPVISAYVGADITSGILATGLAGRRGTVIFIDIGTNGEMVIAHNGQLAASSTAAGPCFEGMNISCGMRAARGAIETFTRSDDGTISYNVIGGAEGAEEGGSPPTGICGSGLLDITGELVRTGVIEKSGRFADAKKTFYITDNVFLSQKDVRQVQLAKAAIRCGIEMLLEKLYLTPQDVDAVIIAGSFGYHLNEKSLINIGLLPEIFAGKIEFAGNTSLSGGTAFLLNTELRSGMENIVKQVQKVELADDPEFENKFVACMSF